MRSWLPHAANLTALAGILTALAGAAQEPSKPYNPYPYRAEWAESILVEAPSSFEQKVAKMKDTGVGACDNFFKHACGGWVKGFKLPKHRSSWTYGFDTIEHRVTAQLQKVMQGKAGKLPQGLRQKLMAYHGSCMNTKVRAAGVCLA